MQKVARASLIVAVFFTLDKGLGFVRQLLVARQFSLSYDLDVFNAANNIPDLLSALISGGALGVALIPVLSEYLKTRGGKDAWILFSRILNLAFIITGIFAALIALAAPWLVGSIIAPGFPLEQKLLTVRLMRLDLIAILIFSISGLVMAGLQANQHFLTPAMAPGLYNIGQIIGVAIFSPSIGYQIGPITLPALGMGIEGLVVGVIMGACLHLLIQVPALIKHHFTWKFSLGLSEPGVKKVLTLLGPRVLTMFFLQIFFIARDNLASRLGEGAISAINLGWFIMQVPETLLGTAMAIAMLPTISELFAQNNIMGFSKTINSALRILFALSLPASAFLAIGIEPIIQVGFNFSAEGTQMVVMATRLYLLGMISQIFLEIGSRSFYAQQNARIPLLAAAFNAAIFIPLAILLTRSLGYIGIPISITIAFTAEALMLLLILKHSYHNILDLSSTLLRTVAGTVLFSFCLFIVLNYIPLPIPPFIASLAGMVISLCLMLIFVYPEIRLLFRKADF
jgi:putative peptidoglycan lipid II flippase